MKIKILILVLCSIVFFNSCTEDPISPIVPQSYLASAFSLSDGRMWTVGAYGNIFYSTNFGKTFVKQNSNTNNILLSIIINGNYGLITGEKGVVLISKDAGLTWKVSSPGTIKYLKSACFENGITYVCGQESSFFVSNDSGTTWQSYQLDLKVDFNRIKSESNLYLLSRTINQTDSSKLYRLLQDRKTLDSTYLPEFTNYLSDAIEIGNSVLVFGSGVIFKYDLDGFKNLINGKVVWDKTNLDSIQKYDYVVFEKAISFGSNVYAFGYYGYNIGVIYKSTDSGLTWKRIYDGKDLIHIFSATAFDENNIIATGGFGNKILTSTDSGVTWFLKTLE
jgi:photosystem II stability/assembly factor-like uncharacterized protein